MNEEMLLLILQSVGTGGQCGVYSPDAAYTCTIRKGHEGDCRNLSVKVSWCGWCSAWTCRKPEVHAERTS